jgi:hypothetical protein
VTTQTLSRIAGGIAIVAVLVVSGMVAWSVLQRSDPDPSGQQAEGPRADEVARLGDLTGYVGQVDPDTHTIVVAASPLGADPVMLVVTGDAAVTVHGQQGALGDLSKDMPVRVLYEVRNEVKHATSIQVIAESAHTAAPPSTDGAAPAADAAPAIGATRTVETKSPVDARTAVEAKPPPDVRVPAEVKAPPHAGPQPAATPPPPALKTRRPEPSSATISTAESPTARPARAPAPAADSASDDRPQAATSRPGEGDADDGSAAVDWLLKGPGR